MRTTLILDDELIAKARELTGIEEKTRLIHMGLEALVQRAAAKRLAALGGSMKNFTVASRDRYSDPALMVAEGTVDYSVTPKRKK
jgi:Arc/MetJ family transcription regulator